MHQKRIRNYSCAYQKGGLTMGCHTWFNNKVSCITDNDIKKLKEYHKLHVKNAYIYKCSLTQWLSDIKKDLKDFHENYQEPYDELAQMEFDMLTKMNSKEYYEIHRNKYVEALKKLNDDTTSKDELLKIFDELDLAFNIEDDDYSLKNCGWCDQYRVSGYPRGTFHNADEAIKFLEEYDNGNGNITYDFKNGMCNEIREIIKEFFKQYPNGSIHYG